MDVLEWMVLLFVFCTLAVILYLKIRIIQQSAQFQLDAPPPTEGIAVPLLSAFRSLPGLGMFALSDNNLFPRLVLYNNHLEYRLLFRGMVDYACIRSIHVSSWGCLHFLRFDLSDSRWTLGLRFANTHARDQVAAFFRQRGIAVVE